MSRRSLCKVLLFCSSGVFTANAAHGQALETPAAETVSAQSGEERNADSDIVVIGRGRNEQLQDAPVSVTAFSSQDLTDARVHDVSDFIALTPGVSITQSQSVGISFVTIRGIAQVRNGESSVAVVKDGVQQINSRQFTADLFDIKQIEVLRGPQGALYGRNAIGGAIVITTEQPTNDFRLNVNASIGNGSDRRLQASVAGPIIEDRLLFRLAGSYHDFGGLFHNDYLGVTEDKLRDRSVRGQLKAIVSDTLTIDTRASYSRTKGDGYLFQFQGAKFDPANPCFLDPANPFGGPLPDADRVSRTPCTNNRGSSDRTITDASVRIENAADWGTITNTLAYVRVKEFIGSDQFPFSASRNVFGTDGTQTGYEEIKAIQNDLRIASNENARFKWMFGAYFLSTKRFVSSSTGIDKGQGIIEIIREPAYADPTNPTVNFLADNNRNQTYAFYGNVGYDITDRLDIGFAYRYDHDRRRQIIDPSSSAGVPVGCTPTSDAKACSRVAKFHKGQPKVTINYRPTDDLTLFADYGVGFRSGQFNQSGAAAQANFPGVFDLVRAESAATTEAGVKAKLLDGRLSLNATAYHTIDKDSFYFLFVAAAGAQVLVNIDKAELYGAEIEADFTPTPGLNIFASYGFTHSKITRFSFNPADVGNKLPYVPADGGVIGAQYRLPLTDAFGLFARGEVEHRGKQYWDPDNSTARSSFRLINLQLGLEGDAQRWSLTGYVRNLTDKKYNAEFVLGGFVQPAPPRTFGLDLRYKI